MPSDSVIAVAGSSGLIGTALVYALRATDHRVVRIVRRAPSNADEVFWNPDTGEFDAGALRRVDAVVNLCGVNVGEKRWSGAFKQSLRDSRIGPTEVLSRAVVEAGVPVLVNSSAVGYYGDTGARPVDETAAPGQTFLARLTVDWEAATTVAAQSGVRVVLPAPAWSCRPRAECWAGSARCSRSASGRGWATAASTCRGSASRTRCGHCCSRSRTTTWPVR